jgi:hypothetical protein
MRTRITMETLYPFNELSEKAQDHAIEHLWDLNVDDSYWYEFIEEDIERLGEISGLACEYGKEFDIDSASYVYIKNISTTIHEIFQKFPVAVREYPDIGKDVLLPFLDSFTAREKKNLVLLQKRGYLETLSGETSRGRRGTQWHIESFENARQCPRVTALIEKLGDAWAELLTNLEHCYTCLLRREYEYQTSREAIIDSIEANSYEFTEKGNLA